MIHVQEEIREGNNQLKMEGLREHHGGRWTSGGPYVMGRVGYCRGQCGGRMERTGDYH